MVRRDDAQSPVEQRDGGKVPSMPVSNAGPSAMVLESVTKNIPLQVVHCTRGKNVVAQIRDRRHDLAL